MYVHVNIHLSLTMYTHVSKCTFITCTFTVCNEWSTYQFPGLPQDTGRFGHTSLLTNNDMLIYGGFQGVMFHELLLFQIVNCSMYMDEEECVNDTFCGWIESVALCTRLDLSLNISDLVLECDFGE